MRLVIGCFIDLWLSRPRSFKPGYWNTLTRCRLISRGGKIKEAITLVLGVWIGQLSVIHEIDPKVETLPCV